jgi:hypothetical protein
MVFREAEQRFLLLFLEKEEYYQTNGLLESKTQSHLVGFAEVWVKKWSSTKRTQGTENSSINGINYWKFKGAAKTTGPVGGEVTRRVPSSLKAWAVMKSG